eukprot:6204321-Pleurochrysis_carterae.AAC.2
MLNGSTRVLLTTTLMRMRESLTLTGAARRAEAGWAGADDDDGTAGTAGTRTARATGRACAAPALQAALCCRGAQAGARRQAGTGAREQNGNGRGGDQTKQKRTRRRERGKLRAEMRNFQQRIP